VPRSVPAVSTEPPSARLPGTLTGAGTRNVP
jgi:hypothetical protein